MFGWRKKRASADHRMPSIVEEWVRPQALLVAIIEAVKARREDIAAGRAKDPAHEDRDSGVLGNWRGTRLDALRRMLGFGKADLGLLTDPRDQQRTITAFLVDRPHLTLPQPMGETMADTIQAVWQVYLYLTEVGTAVRDNETDRFKLRLARTDIIAGFTQAMTTAQQAWSDYEAALNATTGALPPLPRTVIELLYEDVSRKAKSIALSSMFGSPPEANIQYMRSRLSGNPTALGDFDALMTKIMQTNDPDTVDV